MEAKFKIGDRFTRKFTYDYPVLEITGIKYTPVEPVYELDGVIIKNAGLEIGELGLEKLYNKIK